MSTYVQYAGHLVPYSLFAVDVPKPGACVMCYGLGLVPESLDDERPDEMVPCWKCKGNRNDKQRDI